MGILIRIIELSKVNSYEINRILVRASLDMREIKDKVLEIIDDVRTRGDKAIIDFYEKFYGRRVLTEESLAVTKEEIKKAYEIVDPEIVESLRIAKKNIEKFHAAQLPKDEWYIETMPGMLVGQVWRPIESVGTYIPGGRAAYPSTALMLCVPAKVAGVPKIVATTPPRPDGSVSPYTLVALDIAGVNEIYKVGGAHAVAALAFGTETIPKVEKVVGPGNIWVNAAKALLRDVIGIDFIAGPSEVLIIATDGSDPEFIAWDMISQAEHDPMSSAILVTTSEKLAHAVARKLDELVPAIGRKEIVLKSLQNYGAIVIANDMNEAIRFVNEYAPEHLEIMTENLSEASTLIRKVRNAGTVFVGPYSPVPMGDYVIGGNHTLPTDGHAKRRGGLGVLDFIKLIDVQIVTPNGIKAGGPHAIRIATAEGLVNHAKAIQVRLNSLYNRQELN